MRAWSWIRKGGEKGVKNETILLMVGGGGGGGVRSILLFQPTDGSLSGSAAA